MLLPHRMHLKPCSLSIYGYAVNTSPSEHHKEASREGQKGEMESEQIKTSVRGGGNNADNSEKEKKKMALMRVFVERQDPDAKWLNVSQCDCLRRRRLNRHPNIYLDENCIYLLGCYTQEVDNLTLRRFLCARDLDIEKASAMFLKYLKWKKTAVPNGFISEKEIQNELTQTKVFMQGRDKAGRRIGVVFGAKHFYATREMDEFKRK
ncbi:hypothetical protein B296_00030283 [Ensete ventricosum]|uniref:CRAL/TRIO N-terminal domain-containing protein n=1 Tax=Ensete ventricosum TaxID=4639 RepID=A0A426Z5D6_ENSVE|nr:hypothetical protein B296_00030283 [Ensete ventricosum]